MLPYKTFFNFPIMFGINNSNLLSVLLDVWLWPHSSWVISTYDRSPASYKDCYVEGPRTAPSLQSDVLPFTNPHYLCMHGTGTKYELEACARWLGLLEGGV